MARLRSLALKASYHKGEDDIAAAFYLPCMNAAAVYDRAVGFFNSTIYTLAWPSLASFVARGGRMRIVCSPVLLPADIEALDKGYHDKIEAGLGERLRVETEQLLLQPFLSKPATVLASLVALGAIDVRIALLGARARHRLFHDKVGIFTDPEGDRVVFKGSMNETWSGLSSDGNLESVDVFASWEDSREASRVADEVDYFERLWADNYPEVRVCRFPEVARELLLQAANVSEWERIAQDISDEITAPTRNSAPTSTGPPLRPHQKAALRSWLDAGRRGILEHATGSGKTFTALCAVRDALGRGEVALILVPSELLLKQWKDEAAKILADISPRVLICGGGETSWRTDSLLSPWTRSRNSSLPRITISTIQTACTPEFRASLQEGEHLFVVADEVHRLGSPQYRTLLNLNCSPRLGLSATPRRAGDAEGTDALLDFFGGILQPPFTLTDAIGAKALTPYFYYVHRVTLTADEQQDWDALANEVGRIYARSGGDPSSDPDSHERLKLLLIRRARIVKAAANKVPLALDVLRRFYAPGQKWLVYCESLAQLRSVRDYISAEEFATSEYHSMMQGDRQATLRHFDINGGILLSIRCLDEGVDIPSVTHALILASSQNPREFIQRRGRILRRAADKHFAHLHDALVVPQVTGPEPPNLSVVESEMVRAIEFGKTAENPSAITDLERIALTFGLDRDKYFGGGIEDDDSTQPA